jgi:hypothetical protein
MPSDSVISGNQSDCNSVKACLVQCGLCHGTSGAFRRTLKGQWVHSFCAEVIGSCFSTYCCFAWLIYILKLLPLSLVAIGDHIQKRAT